MRALAHPQVRKAQGCFWIEGIRNFVQACDAKLTFDIAIHSRVLLKSDLAEMLVRRLAARGVARVRVSPEQFRSISTTSRASGIGAIVRQHWLPLERARPGQGLCWIVIEEIRSPGNLGTILRTAEACGAAGIIFVGPSCDPFDPAVVRASMGGIFHL
ncbi:MAG TPA: TrmH family RNA methyltransferase, partial [Roseiflexaceae bacterium]